MTSIIQTAATVCISRASGGGEDTIRIKIMDEATYASVTIDLPLDQYAMAATSGRGEGQATWLRIDKVGLRREVKGVNIPREAIYGDGYGSKVDLDNSVRNYLLPQCVDGWFISDTGVTSRQDGKMWHATMSRYVEPTR